jgi:hypothetical protein
MTKTTLKMLLLLLLPLAASTALSDDSQGQNQQNGGWVRAAPEIDLAYAAGALALLGGTLAIIRGYRRGEKK